MPNTTNLVSSSYYAILKRGMTETQFNLKSITIPMITLGTVEYVVTNVRIKKPGESVTFDALDFEVLLDKSATAFMELYDELVLLSDPETNKLQQGTNNTFEMTVVITTNKNNPNIRVVFKDVVIQSFGGILFDIDSNEKTRMSVSAEYTTYKPELIT